jgi:hypothetical protein
MNVDTAVRLVNEIKFFPGWQFEASDHCNRFEESITVKVSYPSWETNKEVVMSDTWEANRPHATFPLMVGNIKDDLHLYRVLMHVISEINSHEAREAFRVAPTYWAPFHPHKTGGIMQWIDTESVCEDYRRYLPDMHFGVA